MQRPSAPKKGLCRSSSTYFLAILVCVTVALVALANYTLWLRRSCVEREASQASGAAALQASAEALAAEVKRLQSQVTYLTGPASITSQAAGGVAVERVRHRAPQLEQQQQQQQQQQQGAGVQAPLASSGAASTASSPGALPLSPLPREAWRAAPLGSGQAPEPAPVQPSAATALLVICYNRPAYLRRTLGAVLARLPSYSRPHVYVSQDGEDAEVRAVVAELAAQFQASAPDVPFTHWQHPKATPTLRGGGAGDVPAWATSYYKLAQHFGWALQRLFEERRHPHVIVLEDDLEVAPDFFDYMTAMQPLLDADPTLLAASSYNDLGQAALVADPRQVLRSDFFPGLGWMINQRTWVQDLGPKWPDSFWDDWLREPPQRKGRQVLRPEVSRTVTFGEKGVSQSQFFSQFLATVQLNEVAVDWAGEDLGYLQGEAWAGRFQEAVAGARSVQGLEDFWQAQCQGSAQQQVGVKYAYGSLEAYPAVASRFSYIDDAKAGVPRTAYQGVVTFMHRGCRKFAVPS